MIMSNGNRDNSLHPKSKKPRVIVGATYWTLNGVNIFSANLVRGLREKGLDAHILLTEEKSRLVNIDEKWMERPSDIPFVRLPLYQRESWGGNWGALIRYLEEQAPCIYIPNSDWRHSCVAPLLSGDVGIIGVVHSDDPLHYDHVARQGKYWNAITATSDTVARKTVELNPDFLARLTTISIGVDIPFTPPKRSKSPSDQLKLIYHGTLKQHQKRILDMPEIMAKLAKENIAVQLNLVGGGPDEDRVIKASENLVKREYIRFHGVVPHPNVLEMLEQNDVYLLTSEFEGMPNALLEAMGRGCVPIVTDMDSAVPQLVEDGHNGYVVPIGDIDAFVKRIKMLHAAPDNRQMMSLNAYESVSKGNFRIQNMVQAYADLVETVFQEMKSNAFKRPPGILTPPPVQVAGVNIFPVELAHKEEGIGLFPTQSREYKDFKKQIEHLTNPRSPLYHLSLIAISRYWESIISNIKDVRVIVGSPSWTRTGVNDFSADIVRELINQGIDAEILLTEENTDLVTLSVPFMPKPVDIPIHHLPVDRTDSWGAHWGAMIRYLEDRAPCIYFPNYDWRHSCVSPLLSNRVAVIGVTPEDDPLHYNHIHRLGRYWNAIVAVNDTVADKIQTLNPEFKQRLTVIPSALNIPAAAPQRKPAPEAPLRFVCQGAFDHKETEIIGSIIRLLKQRQVPAEFTMIGYSGSKIETVNVLENLGDPGTIRVFDALARNELLNLFEQSHFFVLISDFDGARKTLQEAMGRGCVPIVTDTGKIEGLAKDLIRDGSNGCRLPINNLAILASRLAQIFKDREKWRQMSLNAYDTVAHTNYKNFDMVRDYLKLFDKVISEIRNGSFQRPKGILHPPPSVVAGTPIFTIESTFEETGVGLFPNYDPDYIQFKSMARLSDGQTLL